jgi:hypothetical protein
MTETTTKRNQGDKVTFNLSEKVIGLTGKVSGVMGPIIIVNLDMPIKDYPYTHIYIVDAQITN